MITLDRRWAIKFQDNEVQLWHMAPRGWSSRWKFQKVITNEQELNEPLDFCGLTLRSLLIKHDNQSVIDKLFCILRGEKHG